MKTILFLLFALTFILPSCGNNKSSKTTITSEDGKDKITVDPINITNAADEMQHKVDELKKLPALTADELKALIPEELEGIKRSSFDVNTMMGFALGQAEYKKDDTTLLKLVIYDCAGEAGSAFYSMNYWMKMNMESQSDDRYTKTVEFKGKKAIESYEKYNDEYTLVYFANDRLLVSMQGDHTGLDMVKDAAQSLNLKVD